MIGWSSKSCKSNEILGLIALYISKKPTKCGLSLSTTWRKINQLQNKYKGLAKEIQELIFSNKKEFGAIMSGKITRQEC